MADNNDEQSASASEKRSRDEDVADDDVAAAEPPTKMVKTGDAEASDDLETAAPDETKGESEATAEASGEDAAKAEGDPSEKSPDKDDKADTTGLEEEANAEGKEDPATAESTAPPTQDASGPEADASPVGHTSVDASAAESSSLPPSGLPPGLPGSGQPVSINPYSPDGGANPEAVVEEKGEVSALYVGRVIGKGGEMIRDLQARSACRIDVDQNVPPGMPRLITYRGTRKTVDFAKQLVRMLCQENVNEADLPLGEAKREYLVVPASSVGKIIGRGGEMIRELQSRSQAKIQVDHSGSTGVDANEKQVTITGTDQAVVKAKEMVLFLVANPMMDAMQSLNMLVEDKVQRGGVWGSGPPYPNMPQNGQNMQPNASGGGGGGYGGYDQSYYGAAATGGASAYVAAPGQYGAPPVAAAYVAPTAAPVYQQPAATSYGGGVESEVFFAAKSFMGRIIGSKGVTINDLQRTSACDIQINQDVPPGRDCEITIRGTRQGIEMVKQMLREIIEIGPNHPYAGGRGGQSSYGGYQQSVYGMQQQQQQPYGYQAQGGYGRGGFDAYGQQAYGQTAGYAAGGASAQPFGAAQYQAAPQAAYGAPPPGAPAVSEWKAATAPDGQVYYYNERSGETTWQKPPGMP